MLYSVVRLFKLRLEKLEACHFEILQICLRSRKNTKEHQILKWSMQSKIKKKKVHACILWFTWEIMIFLLMIWGLRANEKITFSDQTLIFYVFGRAFSKLMKVGKLFWALYIQFTWSCKILKLFILNLDFLFYNNNVLALSILVFALFLFFLLQLQQRHHVWLEGRLH